MKAYPLGFLVSVLQTIRIYRIHEIVLEKERKVSTNRVDIRDKQGKIIWIDNYYPLYPSKLGELFQ